MIRSFGNTEVRAARAPAMTVEVPVKPDLSSRDWMAIRVAEIDAEAPFAQLRHYLRFAPRVRRLVEFLLGLDAHHGFADPKLETLRQFAVGQLLRRRRGESERTMALAAGYASTQLERIGWSLSNGFPFDRSYAAHPDDIACTPVLRAAGLTLR